MASYNKVQVIGNLGGDPELRYLPDGTKTVTISVATTNRWTDKNTGEVKERTEWHRLVFFRKLAEVVAEHLKKGSQIFAEGEIRYRKWTDKEGIERYTTEIAVHLMQMLGKKPVADMPIQDEGADGVPMPPAPDDYPEMDGIPG